MPQDDKALVEVTEADIAAAEAHYPPGLWRREAIDDLADCLARHRIEAQASDKARIEALEAAVIRERQDHADRQAELLNGQNRMDLRIVDLEAENARLREAHRRLRNGYADAASGLTYVRTHHGNLPGVGFDRVADHFHEWVTIREREGLLAGSHELELRNVG